MIILKDRAQKGKRKATAAAAIQKRKAIAAISAIAAAAIVKE